MTQTPPAHRRRDAGASALPSMPRAHRPSACWRCGT